MEMERQGFQPTVTEHNTTQDGNVESVIQPIILVQIEISQ